MSGRNTALSQTPPNRQGVPPLTPRLHPSSVSTCQQEAQLSQRDRAAACLNYGKNISAKSVHLGYFFKVQWQQYRAAHSLGSLIMSMPASVT